MLDDVLDCYGANPHRLAAQSSSCDSFYLLAKYISVGGKQRIIFHEYSNQLVMIDPLIYACSRNKIKSLKKFFRKGGNLSCLLLCNTF